MRPVTSPDATSTTQPSHERHERARVSTPWEDQASSTPQRWQGATSSTTVWTSSSREGTHSNEPHDRRPATPVAGSTQAVTLADPMTELLNVDLALDVRVLVSACGVSAAGTLKFGGLPSVVDRTTTTLHIRRSDTTHGGSSYETSLAGHPDKRVCTTISRLVSAAAVPKQEAVDPGWWDRFDRRPLTGQL